MCNPSFVGVLSVCKKLKWSMEYEKNEKSMKKVWKKYLN